MNVWVAPGDGPRRRVLLDEPHEHAEPSWGPGQRSFAWAPDGQRDRASTATRTGSVAWCACRSAGRAGRRVAKGWHAGLDWGAARHGVHPLGRAHARRSSPCSIPRRRRAARASPRCAGRARRRRAAEPTPVAWTGDAGATVHGLLWLPPAPVDATGGHPPLLVDVHGGPTDQSTVDWKPRVRYFVVARWAVLQPELPGFDRVRPRLPPRARPRVGRRRRRRHRGRDPGRRPARAGPTRRAPR